MLKFLTFIFSVFISTQALAIHEYHKHRCSTDLKVGGKERHLHLIRQDGSDGSGFLSDQSGNDLPLNITVVDSQRSYDAKIRNLILFTELPGRLVNKYGDGCWSGSTGSYEVTLKFLNFPGVSRKFEIKVKCDYDDLSITGDC